MPLVRRNAISDSELSESEINIEDNEYMTKKVGSVVCSPGVRKHSIDINVSDAEIFQHFSKNYNKICVLMWNKKCFLENTSWLEITNSETIDTCPFILNGLVCEYGFHKVNLQPFEPTAQCVQILDKPTSMSPTTNTAPAKNKRKYTRKPASLQRESDLQRNDISDEDSTPAHPRTRLQKRIAAQKAELGIHIDTIIDTDSVSNKITTNTPRKRTRKNSVNELKFNADEIHTPRKSNYRNSSADDCLIPDTKIIEFNVANNYLLERGLSDINNELDRKAVYKKSINLILSFIRANFASNKTNSTLHTHTHITVTITNNGTTALCLDIEARINNIYLNETITKKKETHSFILQRKKNA